MALRAPLLSIVWGRGRNCATRFQMAPASALQPGKKEPSPVQVPESLQEAFAVAAQIFADAGALKRAKPFSETGTLSLEAPKCGIGDRRFLKAGEKMLAML
ncbi:MAG: hypothetical protein LBU32_03405 [Clostridiales bacterium]|nr:hypothetical protein [Clostridiales bacterium]